MCVVEKENKMKFNEIKQKFTTMMSPNKKKSENSNIITSNKNCVCVWDEKKGGKY